MKVLPARIWDRQMLVSFFETKEAQSKVPVVVLTIVTYTATS